MTALFFEGEVRPVVSHGGLTQVATAFQCAEGREKESFAIILQSNSVIGIHPVMDQLAGKKVRIIFQEMP